MIRIISTFICFIFFLTAYAEDIPRLTAEAEPLSTVCGCINIVSGDFFQIDEDIALAGPEPLSLTRIYDSGHSFRSEFGIGVGLNFPLRWI